MTQSGKYALVTGASSGIGREIAKELAVLGYSIIAVSNQRARLDELKEELESAHEISVLCIDTDLSLPGAGRTLFDFCEKTGLEVEVLVNNAGMLVMGPFAETGYLQAESILHLHMTTPAGLCRLFGEKMVKGKKGYILNVSSISAVMPYPVISLYGPTKTFLRSFTRAIRTELNHDGINVTCLLPGATATTLYDSYKVNIPLAMRLGVMKKPGTVARAGIRALFANRPECIPGMLNKLVVLLLPLIPHTVIGWIYRSRQKRTARNLPG